MRVYPPSAIMRAATVQQAYEVAVAELEQRELPTTADVQVQNQQFLDGWNRAGQAIDAGGTAVGHGAAKAGGALWNGLKAVGGALVHGAGAVLHGAGSLVAGAWHGLAGLFQPGPWQAGPGQPGAYTPAPGQPGSAYPAPYPYYPGYPSYVYPPVALPPAPPAPPVPPAPVPPAPPAPKPPVAPAPKPPAKPKPPKAKKPKPKPKKPSGKAKLEKLKPAQLAHLGATNKKAFFAALRPAAEEAQKKYGVPAAITLAQAALETGWGGHLAAGYNLFGIKGKGPAGSHTVRTREVYGGKSVYVNAAFASYHNFYEAVEAHGKLFHNGYYTKALANYRRTHSVAGFAKDITGTYATDPSYGQKLMSIIKQYKL